MENERKYACGGRAGCIRNLGRSTREAEVIVDIGEGPLMARGIVYSCPRVVEHDARRGPSLAIVPCDVPALRRCEHTHTCGGGNRMYSSIGGSHSHGRGTPIDIRMNERVNIKLTGPMMHTSYMRLDP